MLNTVDLRRESRGRIVLVDCKS